MNGMINAANKNLRSIGGNFTHFYSSASSGVSEEIYSQQAFIFTVRGKGLYRECFVHQEDSSCCV